MMEEKGTRLSSKDIPSDVVMKMADGNPGAMRVGMELLGREAKIDPDSALGGLAALLTLDMHHIYAEHIWMLYKDVCGEDLVRMVAVLRAVQLGFITSDVLKHAINNYGDGVDVDNLVLQVKARLPRFGTEEEVKEGGN